MNKTSTNFFSFIFGVVITSIVILFIVYLNKSSLNSNDIFLLDENISNQNIGEETENNTSVLDAYKIDPVIKNSICDNNGFKSLDELNENQYEEFLVYSLQSNPGGNSIFYFIRDYTECEKLNKMGIVSNERIFDCKLKRTTQTLINNEIPNPNHLLEIINLIPDYQIVVDSFESGNCNPMAVNSSSMVNYCEDKEIFVTFKQQLFEKNLNQLCQ